MWKMWNVSGSVLKLYQKSFASRHLGQQRNSICLLTCLIFGMYFPPAQENDYLKIRIMSQTMW